MILDKFSLNGKNALVTGSSRGLGAAIAIALAEAGANVACHGKSEDEGKTCKRIRHLGGNTVYLAGDVAKREVQTELIQKTIEEFGQISRRAFIAGHCQDLPGDRFHFGTGLKSK